MSPEIGDSLPYFHNLVIVVNEMNIEHLAFLESGFARGFVTAILFILVLWALNYFLFGRHSDAREKEDEELTEEAYRELGEIEEED